MANSSLFSFQAKKEIYDVKQQRLYLAQDEYNHLQTALTTLNTSRTSCKYSVIYWYIAEHEINIYGGIQY